MDALLRRAIELDPQNVTLISGAAYDLSLRGRFAEAERLCDRWQELQPGRDLQFSVRAANLWKWTGDLKRALAILEEGVKTGVNGEPVLVELSAIHEALGDTAAAISDWENVRAIIASLPAAGSGRRARSIDAGHRIAQLHRRAGRPAQAAALYAEFLPQARQLAKDFPDEQRGPSLVALMLAGRGEKAEALAALDEAKQFGARGRDASELARIRNASAEVLALLGEKDTAIAELRANYEASWAFGYTLRTDARWAPLRGDVKFQQLMKDAEARADAQPRPKK